MSSFVKQALLQSRTPLTQSQRFRGKINIQRPQKPHYERARMIAVTQPKYPDPPKTTTCFQPAKDRLQTQVLNPYNNIIAREVRNWLDNSRMVAIFHMNSITADEFFRVRVQLHKHNMHVKSYGKKIIEMAVKDTRYEAILPLFVSSHCMVFSSEAQVSQLIRITRKVPHLILMAGIVHDKLLSRNELINYAQLPGLQSAQAELVNTINMAASNLVKQLETHQNNFVNVLDIYAKSADTEGTSSPSSSTEEPQKE